MYWLPITNTLNFRELVKRSGEKSFKRLRKEVHTLRQWSICKTIEFLQGKIVHRIRMTLHSVQSVELLSCVRLCDPMNCRMPGLPVHHQLLEFTQTHVHRVADAIQPSHPLSSPSPPAPNPSQHQSLFQRVSSLHEVAKVLEFQL